MSTPPARDAFDATCPSRQILATLGDKWTVLIVNVLADGARRHGQISTTIAGASQKMLTQTLRVMERDGVVSRTVTPTVPVRVDYELTDLGRTLLPVMRDLKTWPETHLDQIATAQAAYDLLHPKPLPDPEPTDDSTTATTARKRKKTTRRKRAPKPPAENAPPTGDDPTQDDPATDGDPAAAAGDEPAAVDDPATAEDTA